MKVARMFLTGISARLSGPVISGALAYGILIFLLLPPGVTVLNDDFGYLRSVVETLQHGRPWTDDWLGPWAAGLSVLSALVFKLTGSFFVATNGLLVGFAVLAFWAGGKLLQHRGLSARRAAGTIALLLTFPTLLWKSLEFGSVALGMVCLLAALLAAERRRWGWFGLCWLLALATRQSALTWVVLPAAAALQALLDRRSQWRARWLAPTVVAVAGVVAFVILSLVMNKTHEQIRVTDAGLDRLAEQLHVGVGLARIIEISALGIGVFLLAAGAGAWSLRGSSTVRRRLVWWRAAIAIEAVALLVLFGRHVAYELDGFRGTFSVLYESTVLLIAFLGWLWTPPWTIRWPAIACAVAGIMALCSRPVVWDYYFMDVALLGFFGVSSPNPEAITRPSAGWTSLRPSPAWIILAMLIAWQAIFVFNLKLRIDRGHALIVLGEKALRAGQLHPAELALTPSGFVGWQLHPYYIAHDGRRSSEILGYRRYLARWRDTITLGQSYSPPLPEWLRFPNVAPLDSEPTLIGQVSFRCAWFFHGDIALARIRSQPSVPPALTIDPDDYRPQPFPLNDAEWRALVQGERIMP